MDKSLTSRRVVGIIFLAWIAIIGFDFLLHGGILAGLYIQSSSFLLPPDKAFLLIPLGYLSFLIFQIFIVWLMIQLNITGWKDGMFFGLKVGAFVWGAGIGGLVAGSGFAKKKLVQLILYVLLFFLIAIIVTIVLQSVCLSTSPNIINK